MQISFSSGTFYHRGAGYSLQLARTLGYDGIELALSWDYMLRGDRGVERALRRTAGRILSVHPPFLPLPGWPRDVPTRLQRLVTAARELGAGILVLHTPFLRGEDSPRARWYAQALEQARAAAGDAVRICLENNEYRKRSQRYLLDDLRTLARFAEEHGCGITLDTCHLGANGEDLLRSYEIVRPLLANLHLSDLHWMEDDVKTHVTPGNGALPLRELLGMVARDGYDGLVTLEVHPRDVGLFGKARQRRVLREALAFTREALGVGVPVAESAAGSVV